MRHSVELNMTELGAEFANMGDTEQAAFFHGLAIELGSWPTHFAWESQGCAVGMKLSERDTEILREFLDGVTSTGPRGE